MWSPSGPPQNELTSDFGLMLIREGLRKNIIEVLAGVVHLSKNTILCEHLALVGVLMDTKRAIGLAVVLIFFLYIIYWVDFH